MKKYIPIVMTAVAATTMFGLCAWQVQRLVWKEGMIARYEAAKAEEPGSSLPKQADAAAWKSYEFARYRLAVKRVGDTEFHVGPRYIGNKLGYHIHVPARLKDGREVLLNLGWVPAAEKEAKDHKAWPHSWQRVDVMLRVPPQPVMWIPDNQPEKNFWFYPDIEAMNSSAERKMQPVVLELLGDAPMAKGLPLPLDGKTEFRNDHFGYAVTWGLVGIGVVVIYLAYRRKEKADKNA